MSVIDYFISDQTLDTRLPIANQFLDVTDIDFTNFSQQHGVQIHFTNDVASGYLSGDIDPVASRAAAAYREPMLSGDRLTVWNETSDGLGWTKDTFRVGSVDEFAVLNGSPDFRLFKFDGVSLGEFLATEDLRDLISFDAANVLFGGLNGDYIAAGRGADIASGESGQDTILGGRGDDTLTGGSGDDLIRGGRGDDLIWGEDFDMRRTGHDMLRGGAGDDTFRYAAAGQGGDTILDFRSGHDTLSFMALGFDGMGPDFDLIVGVNPMACDDVGTFLFDRKTHVLSWDADGSGAGAAVEIATLEHVTNLTRLDFELV